MILLTNLVDPVEDLVVVREIARVREIIGIEAVDEVVLVSDEEVALVIVDVRAIVEAAARAAARAAWSGVLNGSPSPPPPPPFPLNWRSWRSVACFLLHFSHVGFSLQSLAECPGLKQWKHRCFSASFFTRSSAVVITSRTLQMPDMYGSTFI